jgi:phage terminase large subunit
MPTLTIDLRNFENVLNPVYVPDLYKKERYLVLYGGAGSGKSHFACQKILYRTLKEEGHRFLVVRKVARTLRHSVFQLFLNYITEWGIYDLFQIHKSEMTITFKANGNSILFVGVDDPVKLKSIEGVTGVWIEEADELALPDFEEIDRRLRAVFHTYMQIILTYNPVLKSNWTYPRFFGDPPTTKNIAVRKTNYKDNVFIQDDTAYIELLEGYEGNKRRVFTEGEYGFLEHAIYSKWRTIPDSKFPTEDEAIGGLDFGFINPNCLLKIVIDIEEKKVYIDEMIYKRRQTTPMLVANMRELGIPEDMLIVADSEAPDKIKEIQESGFRYVLKSKKGPGSVISGIDAVQQFELLITESSVNVKREIEMYQRRVDKDGNVLEEPEKGLDHAMDALRYPVHYYYRVGVRKGTMA